MKDKMKKVQVGMIIAGVATLSTIFAFIFYKNDAVCNVFLNITVYGAIASYIVGGGIKYGLKAVLGCAELLRNLCPFYFWDIACWLVGLCLGIGIFAMLPIIFVFMNYLELKKGGEEAETSC